MFTVMHQNPIQNLFDIYLLMQPGMFAQHNGRAATRLHIPNVSWRQCWPPLGNFNFKGRKAFQCNHWLLVTVVDGRPLDRTHEFPYTKLCWLVAGSTKCRINHFTQISGSNQKENKKRVPKCKMQCNATFRLGMHQRIDSIHWYQWPIIICCVSLILHRLHLLFFTWLQL